MDADSSLRGDEVPRRSHAWRTSAVCCVISAAGVLALFPHHATYEADTLVVLTPPSLRVVGDNGFAAQSGLVAFAGAVQDATDIRPKPYLLTSSRLRLIDSGSTDNWRVQVASLGNQWGTLYPRAELQVQATGPRADLVEDEVSRLIESVRTRTAELQRKVPTGQRVSVHSVPNVAVAHEVAGSAVNRSLGMTVAFFGISGMLLLSLSLLKRGLQSFAERRGEVMSLDERLQSN